MSSGHKAIALVAVWISAGGAIAVVAAMALTAYSGVTAATMTAFVALAAVAATWLIARASGPPAS